ncbi:MAG: NAD(P)H-hydrate epimerase, partial [Campylobacterota bacterium]
MQNLYYDCYALDKRCYEQYGLSEDILMENAALGISNFIKHRFEKGSEILIVCGPGNNGADGLSVARQLLG